MIISTIVAVGNKNAIGVDNDLPWHMPADLRFFKETTLGFDVIMGRKSFESIGRPLPKRTNIVVTRQKDYYHSGIVIKNSIEDALMYAQEKKVEEVFILGGSNIYHQTQNIWHKLYITKIDVDVPNATAFFPNIKWEHWSLTWEKKFDADDNNPHKYSFNLYERK